MNIVVKVIISLVVLFIVLLFVVFSREEDSFKLIILHNNDMHARFEQTGALSEKCSKTNAERKNCFGGFARVAYKVQEFRKRAVKGEIPNVLFLNAGDTYTGTPWFSLYKDEIASDFLNILKPDAASLGNHEFDEGTDNLASFLTKTKFPVLAANVNFKDKSHLKADMIRASLRLEVDGRKIGIVGYLSKELRNLVRPTVSLDGIELSDEILAINNEADKLKAEGVNIIIALGHSGIEIDKKIAAECPEIDLVIGSHSHTFLYTGEAPSTETSEGEYPTIVTQANGKCVPVVQAYAFTKYLGRMQLEFDNQGNLISAIGAPMLLDSSVPQDPVVLELLEKYRPGVLDYVSIVGTTEVLLDGSCRRNECNLGNLITDAMIDWYLSSSENNFEKSPRDSSLALIVGGGIRASINHESTNGSISKEDLATVLPFGSMMGVMEVTGKILLDALEHAVHRYTDGEKHGEFLQMSGLKVIYDMSRPSYQRVVSASQCYDEECSNVDEAKLYKVVTQNFLTHGGDGYVMFKDKPTMMTNTVDLDIVIKYLKKTSPIKPSIEGRITIKA